MIKKYGETIIWSLFILNSLIIFNDLYFGLRGINLASSFSTYKLFFLSFPIVILLLHSYMTLGVIRSLILILLSASVGTIMEFLGLKYGVIFGGHYTYAAQPNIFGVPIFVTLYWIVFIYLGYTITNSFACWIQRIKPEIRWKHVFSIPLLVAFDGLLVVIIDLFMDPLQVRLGNWSWNDGGAYFGIPVGNFFGWLIVVAISTGAFRVYEYHSHSKLPQFNKTILFIPVMSYGILSIVFFYHAYVFRLVSLALFGTALMLSVVMLNVLVYIIGNRNRK